MVLLRCVDAREAEQMLVEVHEGSFGTHANGHAMARKILRAGYYWFTMENNCCICYNLPIGGRESGAHGCVFQGRKARRVATNIYLRKMSEKPEHVVYKL